MPEYSLWLCREFPRCPPAFPDGFHRKQSAVSLSAWAEPPDVKIGTMLPEASAQGKFPNRRKSWCGRWDSTHRTAKFFVSASLTLWVPFGLTCGAICGILKVRG